MRKVVGYLLAGTALIVCPCHLVVLLPVVLGLLGGTALGTVLAANTGWVFAAAAAYFAFALAGALYLLYQRADGGKESGRMSLPVGREAGNAEQTEARKA